LFCCRTNYHISKKIVPGRNGTHYIVQVESVCLSSSPQTHGRAAECKAGWSISCCAQGKLLVFTNVRATGSIAFHFSLRYEQLIAQSQKSLFIIHDKTTCVNVFAFLNCHNLSSHSLTCAAFSPRAFHAFLGVSVSTYLAPFTGASFAYSIPYYSHVKALLTLLRPMSVAGSPKRVPIPP